MPVFEYWLVKKTPMYVEADTYEEAEEKAHNLDGFIREDLSTFNYHMGKMNKYMRERLVGPKDVD